MRQVLVGCTNEDLENAPDKHILVEYLSKVIKENPLHVFKSSEKHMHPKYELYWRLRENIFIWSQTNRFENLKEPTIFYGELREIVNLIKNNNLKEYKIDLRGTFLKDESIYDFICKNIKLEPELNDTILNNEDMYQIYKEDVLDTFELKEENIDESYNS